MDAEYPTEIKAAFALLQDAAKVLLDSGVDFVIVGGWVPFLFHAERFGHPGTYDVDVLLHPCSLDDHTFEAATEQLICDGYLRAAKNEFQAHRILRVAGKELVFHVDFLNERNPENELQLVEGSGMFRSIFTPVMQAVFKYGGYRTHPRTGCIRFPSVETFIATKAIAASVKKRRRDAFDVFVTVADQEHASFQSRWRDLVRAEPLFEKANAELWKAVHDGDAVEKIFSVLKDLSPQPLPSKDQIFSAFDFLQKPMI
jgi:hypothetical protein